MRTAEDVRRRADTSVRIHQCPEPAINACMHTPDSPCAQTSATDADPAGPANRAPHRPVRLHPYPGARSGLWSLWFRKTVSGDARTELL